MRFIVSILNIEVFWLILLCYFVIKVKGKNVDFLFEDVCFFEESDDKVRVVNSSIFMLINFFLEMKRFVIRKDYLWRKKIYRKYIKKLLYIMDIRY